MSVSGGGNSATLFKKEKVMECDSCVVCIAC